MHTPKKRGGPLPLDVFNTFLNVSNDIFFYVVPIVVFGVIFINDTIFFGFRKDFFNDHTVRMKI